MEYSDLFESVLKAVYMLRDDNGRISLSDVYSYLNDKGKTSVFADDNETLRTILESEDFAPFVKLERVEEDGGQRSALYALLTEDGEQRAVQLNDARFNNPQTLFNWGFMGRYAERIEQLAQLALPESWDEPNRPNGVLYSYIAVTFQRLLQEKKEGNRLAIVETDKWAAFNTGLVDRFYDPIFALFSLNKRAGMQKWVFNAWCTPGNRRAGQVLSRFFDELPRKASYFTKPSEYLYDPMGGTPTLPFDHIMDRLSRLPLEFLQRYKGESFEWPEGEFEADQEFFEKYKAALEEDGLALLHFKDALELSLRRAIKRITSNYRIALPIYDSKRRRMMLLVPMSLDSGNLEKVDIALVVERAKVSRKYVGHTIYTPGMAYRKARMVMRLESDWLSQSMLAAEPHAELTNDDEETQLALDILDAEANADAADKAAKAREEAEAKAAQAANEAKQDYLRQHDFDDVFRPEVELAKVKVVEKIPLDVLQDRSSRYGKKSQPSAEEIAARDAAAAEAAAQAEAAAKEEAAKKKTFLYAPDPYDYELPKDRDYDILGIYREGHGKPYILVGRYKFAARGFTDSGIIEDDEVLFDINSEPNLKGNGTFQYAVNIRLADN